MIVYRVENSLHYGPWTGSGGFYSFYGKIYSDMQKFPGAHIDGLRDLVETMGYQIGCSSLAWIKYWFYRDDIVRTLKDDGYFLKTFEVSDSSNTGEILYKVGYTGMQLAFNRDSPYTKEIETLSWGILLPEAA